MPGDRLGGTTILLALVMGLGLVIAVHEAWQGSRVDHHAGEDCRANLRNLAAAAQMYADERRFYPWPQGVTPGAAREEHAFELLATLHRENYVDSPAIFVCRTSPDVEGEWLDTIEERRRRFRLDATTCSYTWSRRTGASQDRGAPLVGDRCGPDGLPRNTYGHWHVGFRGGNVRRFTTEQLADPDDPVARRIREDLIGYERIVVRGKKGGEAEGRRSEK